MKEKSRQVLEYLKDVFTQYENAENKLFASNQQLLAQTQELSRMATVVKDSNDAITIQDLEGNITAWNAGAVKTYGYSEQEAIKMNVADLVPEEYKAEALDFIVSLKKGELVESLETKRATKDGKTLDVWMVVTRLVDEDGKLIGAATTERDITERKQAEEELRNHQEHLEKRVVERTSELELEITQRKLAEKILAESDSLRELLLDIITHDLKNPAGVINALSETGRKNLPENRMMETIFTTSERLIEVLNQTTILSQAAFGETIPKEALSLNALIKETLDEFTSALSTAEMGIVVTEAPDVTVQANPLIREIFKNYISNAIKYARDGKRIVIETVIEDQTVIVYVKDFGKTVAKADREHVFERQVQLEDAKERGRGLGLSIVKRIALAHDGEVWVEPNTPVGNSFCLRIPL